MGITVVKEDEDRYSLKIWNSPRYILTAEEAADLCDQLRNAIGGNFIDGRSLKD